MEIKDYIQTIKERFAQSTVNGKPIKADPILIDIDDNTETVTFMVQIDYSHVVESGYKLVSSLQLFNEQAGYYVKFKGGKLNRSDPTLFTFVFEATTCNGGM